jgi:hypothetical protein
MQFNHSYRREKNLLDLLTLTTAIASDAKICVGDSTAMYATLANP